MNAPELNTAAWFKSSYSGHNGDCVEVADLPGVVASRDSKNPDGPALLFAPGGWHAFVGSVLRDELSA